MERLFCNGKKDFCENPDGCRDCDYADGSGAVDEHAMSALLSALFGKGHNLDRLKELAKADAEKRVTIWKPEDSDEIKTAFWVACKDLIQIGEILQAYPISRIRELMEADIAGRLVVFPCKPSGVTVYQLRNKRHALGVGVHPRHVGCAKVWGNGKYELLHGGDVPCKDKDFGKTWFLKEDEAQAALEKMKERDDNETD